MGLVNLNNLRKLWNHISNGIKSPSLLSESKYWKELFVKAWDVEEVRIIVRRDIVSFFKGRKTYLMAVAIGALGAAQALGFITQEQFQTLIVMLGGATVATMRAAITTETKK